MWRSPCSCFIHVHMELVTGRLVREQASALYENRDPLFRGSVLLHLPVEEIVERHYDQKGGRSKSVLTFEKKKLF